MDERIRLYLENRMGVSLTAFPTDGIAVEETPKRTDAPRNRVMAHRLADSYGVLITTYPGNADTIASVIQQMTPNEIFSPLTHAELSRAAGGHGETVPQDYFYGFGYVLTSLKDFWPTDSTHTARPLKKKDIPQEQYELRMSESRYRTTDDSIWGFACYRNNDPTFRATELAPFGDQCASIAIAKWTYGPVARLDVLTEELCRGQGYGTAVVSATTKWILEQGEIAVYDAYANNIPSLRIARKLGFACLNQEMRI